MGEGLGDCGGSLCLGVRQCISSVLGMLKDSVLEMLKVFFFFADELKAPFIPALPTTLTLVTYTYEVR